MFDLYVTQPSNRLGAWCFLHQNMNLKLLIFGLVSGDLVGYNRQKAVADHSGRVFQIKSSTQDQVILHLIKNGKNKILRKFLENIRNENRIRKF